MKAKVKQTGRAIEASKQKCRECWLEYAKEYCGAWINDGSNEGRGRECRKPICRECAGVRLGLWLCCDHDPDKKVATKECER